jgi:endonuclease YncB( thermonuclease family)
MHARERKINLHMKRWVEFWKSLALEKATYEDTPTFSLSGLTCRAKVLRVYDGDTLWLAIPYPDNKVFKYRVRLYGYDAPEMHPRTDTEHRDQLVAAALRAKAYLEEWSFRHGFVEAEFYTYDKYGRPLVKLRAPGDTQTINERMVAENFGYAYTGGKKLSSNEQLKVCGNQA